jgi:hypothetical protein
MVMKNPQRGFFELKESPDLSDLTGYLDDVAC